MNYTKIGAITFALWGLIHILGGAVILSTAQTGSIQEGLASIVSAMDLENLTAEPGEEIRAILSFHAFNILWMGLVSLIIAIRLNWKNSVLGFWFNLMITGFADLGLLLFMVPEFIPWSEGFIGPLLFIVAGVSSYVGLNRSTTKNS